MGKRQIGEMQPVEFVITLILAEVACLPMNDPNLPLHFGIVPIITLAFLDILITFIGRKSVVVRTIVDGRSLLVIDKNGIVYENLKKMNMSVDDVLMSARSGGYPDMSKIDYAIVEPNGKLSVIEKAKDPTEPTEAFRPMPLIIDGNIIKENLEKVGVASEQIVRAVQSKKLKVKDVLYMDVRQNGEVYVSPKHKPCYTDKIRITGGKSW